MLFHSLEFFCFACLFFLLWPIMVGRANTRYALLVVASFVFYGWWDWKYLFLIVLSGTIDFFAAQAIASSTKRKRLWLIISIAGNLGILFCFKYLVWVLTNVEAAMAINGGELVARVPAWMGGLPVGISFYTFQSMSYTIDVYRGELKPTRNPFLFFSYISLFPQLVAGPIVRASDILEQLKAPAAMNADRAYSGFRLIVRGLFKKMVIADNLAPFVDEAFAGVPGEHGIIYWWLAVTAFGIQIYCDFSGYTDIARGLANWVGLNFRKNFNHPYIASSLREFWTRWHISLSTWFRDYVYVPLGGSRVSATRAHMNLWITMLLSGIWHGAAWTFVIWGALHAAFVSVERALGWKTNFNSILKTLGTLVIVWFAWTFFRAQSAAQAVDIIIRMFDVTSFSTREIKAPSNIGVGLIALFVIHHAYLYRKEKLEQPIEWVESDRFDAIFTGLLLALCFLIPGPGNAFIYFQF